MNRDNDSGERSVRQVAIEISEEKDLDRLMKLAEELTSLLDRSEVRHGSQVVRHGSAKP